MAFSSLITRLKQSKIVQWALAYLAGAFVLVQALEVVSDPWGLSPRLVQVLHILIAAGLPLALVITWYHGEQGRQRVSRPELLIVTLLLVITGGVIRMVWGPSPVAEADTRRELRLDGSGQGSLLAGDSSGRDRAVRFSIQAPADGSFFELPDQAFAVSPDGRLLVHRWPLDDGSWELRVRPLDAFESTPLRGTEGGTNPFFSPDAQWVGFYRDQALHKVPVAGGAPQRIASTGPVVSRVRWTPEDTLYFSAGQRLEDRARLGLRIMAPMWKMSANGGEAIPLRTTPLAYGAQEYHRHPEPLPGGRGVLYTASSTTEQDVRVLELDSGRDRILVPGAACPRLLPSGHLLYVFEGDLYVRAFDAELLDVVGDPVLVADSVAQTRSHTRYDVSEEGTLVFLPGGELEEESAWFWVDPTDPDAAKEIPGTRRAYNHVSMSPGGDRFVYTRWDGRWLHAYVYDLARGIERAISHPEANAWGPYWFPDGQRLAFGQAGGAGSGLHWAWADGRGPPQALADSASGTVNQVTRDGRVVFTHMTSEGHRDIEEMDPRTGETRILVGGAADQSHGALSPDRTWIAYAAYTSETGRWEVYVRHLDSDSVPQQISLSGALAPLWSPEGDRLFFRSLDGDTVFSVEPPAPGERTDFSLPSVVLAGQFRQGGALHQKGYDLAPDGRFVMKKTVGGYPSIRELRVVVGWDLGLRESTLREGRGPER